MVVLLLNLIEAPVHAPTALPTGISALTVMTALATSLNELLAYRFLTGHGKVIGLPDLRPGTNVEIGGVGRRFSGTYFVTKVMHVLNQQGFLTEFDVSRRI